MPYIPALDGVRAAAILLVMASHFDPTPQQYFVGGGVVGVDLFFVLSGYLITSILVAEHERTGAVRLKAFYIRRALRIWPALATLLAVYCALIPFGEHKSDHEFAVLAAALSVMNWTQAFQIGTESYVEQAWSLSIEEQFYLVWPAVLAALLSLKDRRCIVPVLLTLLATGVLWRCILAFKNVAPARIYFGTDTHADSLLVGCILATSNIRVPTAWRSWGMPFGAICMAGLTLVSYWSSRWFAWELLATACVGAWIVALAPGGSLLSSRPAVWIGKRSYSLYLWHVPILKVLAVCGYSVGLRVLIGVPLAVLAAELSYRFIEQPFLGPKFRLAPV